MTTEQQLSNARLSVTLAQVQGHIFAYMKDAKHIKLKDMEEVGIIFKKYDEAIKRTDEEQMILDEETN